MLLEATKPVDNRGRRRYTHGSARDERTYNLDRLQMVILSNTDLRSRSSFSRAVRPAMDALIDRGTVITVHADDDDIYHHTCSLAILDGIYCQYSVAVQNDALRWFAVNRLRVASPTIRTLSKAMRKRALYPSTWERHLAMEERLDAEAMALHVAEDEIPQIVPITRVLAA